MKPKIAVIVPVYNAEKFLKENLDKSYCTKSRCK